MHLNPVGPYSQAVQAGNYLYVSGQLAIDPKEGKLVASRHRSADTSGDGEHQSHPTLPPTTV